MFEIDLSRRKFLEITATGAGLLATASAQQKNSGSSSAREVNPDDLAKMSIAQATDLLGRKRLSPVDLTKACLARIERLNPALNCFITVTAEEALVQARSAESEIRRGKRRGPLHGIPIALKDLF